MKNILLLIISLCTCLQSAAQSYSAADSALAKTYWQKANRSRLFSQQRQLYLDSALSVIPTHAYYWQQKSMPLSKQMKHELAAPFLDSAVKYDSTRYVEYRAYMNCIFRRHYREALRDFEIARSINGNSGVMDHPYDLYTGLCHLQLNNFDSAQYYIRKCIDSKISKSGADWVHYLHWFYLGISYYEQEEIVYAERYFDSALKQNEYLPEALYYKAQCLIRKEEYKDALVYLQHADSLLKRGYFINEDNARYERYPYQVVPFYLYGAIDWLERREHEK